MGQDSQRTVRHFAIRSAPIAMPSAGAIPLMRRIALGAATILRKIPISSQMQCCDGTMPRTCHYTLGWPGFGSPGEKSPWYGNGFKRVALTQAPSDRHQAAPRVAEASRTERGDVDGDAISSDSAKTCSYAAPRSCIPGAGRIHSSPVRPKQPLHGSIWLHDRHPRRSQREHLH